MERIGDDVLDAARVGDEAALGALWRARQAPLLRYLRAQRFDLAPVVAQQIWTAVAHEIAGFDDGRGSFDRWFFSIAHRICATSLPPPVAADHADDGGPGVAPLRGLDPATAEVVVLRLLAELPTADVAAVTGRSDVEVDRSLTAGLTSLVARAEAGAA